LYLGSRGLVDLFGKFAEKASLLLISYAFNEKLILVVVLVNPLGMGFIFATISSLVLIVFPALSNLIAKVYLLLTP
jgi:hypothetical protein